MARFPLIAITMACALSAAGPATAETPADKATSDEGKPKHADESSKKDDAAPKKDESSKKDDAAPKKDESSKKDDAAPKKDESSKKDDAAPKKDESSRKDESSKKDDAAPKKAPPPPAKKAEALEDQEQPAKEREKDRKPTTEASKAPERRPANYKPTSAERSVTLEDDVAEPGTAEKHTPSRQVAEPSSRPSSKLQLNDLMSWPLAKGCRYVVTVKGTVVPGKSGDATPPAPSVVAPSLTVEATVGCPKAAVLRVSDDVNNGKALTWSQLEEALERRASVAAAADAGRRCIYLPDLDLGAEGLRIKGVSYLCSAEEDKDDKDKDKDNKHVQQAAPVKIQP